MGTGHWTLVLFLGPGCDGCRPLWEALADPRAAGLCTDEAVVAVARSGADPDALRALAPAGARVVVSDAAWRAYRVQGPPFFALIDGTGPPRVATEGVAWGIDQVAGYVAGARATCPGAPVIHPPSCCPRRTGTEPKGTPMTTSELTIDCDCCSLQGTRACDDCVVSFLLNHEPDDAVVIDADEARAMRLLERAGLVPGIRFAERAG